MKEKIQYTIHEGGPADCPEFTVCHWHTYPRESVLQGQQQQVVDDVFSKLSEAQDAYPNAEVSEDGRSREKPCVPSTAPSRYYGGAGGFYNAGEFWGEDDY